MQRRQRRQCREVGQDVLVDQDRLGISETTVHNTMADTRKSRFITDMRGKPFMDGRNSGLVIPCPNGLVRELLPWASATSRCGDVPMPST